jgi:hypothetical protein
MVDKTHMVYQTLSALWSHTIPKTLDCNLTTTTTSTTSNYPVDTQDAMVAQSTTTHCHAAKATDTVDSESASDTNSPRDPVQTVFSIVRLPQTRVISSHC